MRRSIPIMMGAALLAAAALPLEASGKELVYSTSISNRHPIMKLAIDPMFADIAKESGGSLTIKSYYSGQIARIRGAMAAVRDKLADAALIVPSFSRSELPATNILTASSSLGFDTVATAGATAATIALGCPECIKEMKKQKLIWFGNYSTGNSRLICREPKTDIKDLKGLKMRASGGAVRMVKALGAIPVNLPGSESYTALQRKAIDCVLGPLPWLEAYSFHEVARQITDIAMGHTRGIGFFGMNRNSWNALSQKEKDLVIKHMPLGVAKVVLIGYVGEEERIRKQADEYKLTFHQPSGELQKFVDGFYESDAPIILATAKKRGVKNGPAILDDYRMRIAQWEALSKNEIKGDIDKLALALKTEIFDKIDWAKY